MVDLRDFTGLSDALPPSEVIETLNRYFDCVIPSIKRQVARFLSSWATVFSRS
jgi:class 3 adenylate cyclase